MCVLEEAVLRCYCILIFSNSFLFCAVEMKEGFCLANVSTAPTALLMMVKFTNHCIQTRKTCMMYTHKTFHSRTSLK